MTSKQNRKLTLLTLCGGGTLLQITACLGSDPQFLISTFALNSIVSNLITTLYNAILSGTGVA